MDIVLNGLNFEICLVYIEDVILRSTTPEQHLDRLEMVLERLKHVNLKLKPSKCHLMQSEIFFRTLHLKGQHRDRPSQDPADQGLADADQPLSATWFPMSGGILHTIRVRLLSDRVTAQPSDEEEPAVGVERGVSECVW